MNSVPARRIAPLDGFRAIAVLLVVAFHYFSDLAMQPDMAWLYPFGNTFAATPFLKFGNLGVDLFFMVSGFVIAMTLATSRNPVEFAFKRFARLFPAMFLCSLITFAVLMLLPYPTWQVAPIDLIPGWTFTSEHTWSTWLDRRVGLVDGVYWTLFIEVRFYVLAALLYFSMRSVPLLVSVGLVVNAQLVLSRLPFFAGNPDALATFKDWTLYNHLPLFLAGIAFFSIDKRRTPWLAAALAAETFAIVLLRCKFEGQQTLIYSACYLMFVALVCRPGLVAWLGWRPLAAIGASSYSLYLLHNRLGISLTYHLGRLLPTWAGKSAWLPLVMLIVMISLAWLVYRHCEVPARKALLPQRGLRPAVV